DGRIDPNQNQQKDGDGGRNLKEKRGLPLLGIGRSEPALVASRSGGFGESLDRGQKLLPDFYQRIDVVDAAVREEAGGTDGADHEERQDGRFLDRKAPRKQLGQRQGQD